jgi:YEATS domain-containing protein 4
MDEDPGTSQPASAASFCRPIVYGSVASAIKKPDGDHTHRWTLYVRGFNDEDISSYVKKVVFKLHESFQQPNRGTISQ